MSLKHFHLFFIVCSFALFSFLIDWTKRQAAAGTPWPGAFAVSLLGAAAAIGYLAWFVRRYKTLA